MAGHVRREHEHLGQRMTGNMSTENCFAGELQNLGILTV